MVVSAVTNLSNLLIMWDKQDFIGKKLLVKTLYPKGIVVPREKTLYQTENRNVFIEYIQDVTGDNGQTKKRNSELKFNYSALVARSRLTPFSRPSEGGDLPKSITTSWYLF